MLFQTKIWRSDNSKTDAAVHTSSPKRTVETENDDDGEAASAAAIDEQEGNADVVGLDFEENIIFAATQIVVQKRLFYSVVRQLWCFVQFGAKRRI